MVRQAYLQRDTTFLCWLNSHCFSVMTLLVNNEFEAEIGLVRSIGMEAIGRTKKNPTANCQMQMSQASVPSSLSVGNDPLVIDLERFDRVLEEDYSSASSYFSIISSCVTVLFSIATFILGIVVCTAYPEAYYYAAPNNNGSTCSANIFRYLIIAHLIFLGIQLLYTFLTITLHFLSLVWDRCLDCILPPSNWKALDKENRTSKCLYDTIHCLSCITCVPGLLQCTAEFGIIIAISIMLGSRSGIVACSSVSAPFVKMLIAYTVLYWFYSVISALLYVIGAVIGSKWAFNIMSNMKNKL